jgi:hypothetical protein
VVLLAAILGSGMVSLINQDTPLPMLMLMPLILWLSPRLRLIKSGTNFALLSLRR